MSSSAASEVWIVPFFGQGHLFPSIELCKQIASRNYKSTLIVSSHVSNSIPSSLHQYPLVEIAEIPSSPAQSPPQPQPGSDPFQHHDGMHNQMEKYFGNLLSIRGLPVCVVIDVMMGWTVDVFRKFNVPIIGFFTSGACSSAMEHAMWKAHINPKDIKPGEFRLLPGLPQEMALSHSDMKQRLHNHGGPPPHRPHDHGGPPPHRPRDRGGPPPHRSHDHGGPPLHLPPGAAGPGKMGPPELGDQPPWMRETEGSIALMINTCDDLEHPFLNYLANQLKKPVWGVGPLLPEQFYKSAGSESVLLHDHEIRTNRRRANVTEDEVIQWLDSKTPGSVLYVSFGTEVGPSLEEYSELAKALEATTVPFIWVIQDGAGRHGPQPHLIGSGSEIPDPEGYFPDGLDQKVGKRGLIITGWAPQLLILSHPSTGGFLSHCGWNSTLEAIGCGIPILGWPIRGDQNYNAKLVINHLKIGHTISDDLSISVCKDDIVSGIGRMMRDNEMKKRAEMLGTIFGHGFPATSAASLDAFDHLIKEKQVN